MGVNKVMLLGNLGKDPEVRYTNQQMAICSFSIATGERRKDQSGQWVDHTEWHNIVTFGKTAENCSQYLKKGSQAFIEGSIRTRKWQDKEGKDRYTTEIIAQTVQFVGSKSGGKSSGYSVETESSSSGSGRDLVESLPSADAVASGGGGASFDDDDIPF